MTSATRSASIRRIDDRIALGRTAAALGHVLRLLRLAFAASGTPPSVPLAPLEEALSAATLPEEYLEVSSQVVRLTGLTAAAKGGLPKDLHRRLCTALVDLGRALELPAVVDEAARLSDQSEEADAEPVLALARRIALLAAMARETSTVLNDSLDAVTQGIRRVSSTEDDQGERVANIRGRLAASYEVEELGELRRTLLDETDAIAQAIEERRSCLAKLEEEAERAKRKVERLAAALADATSAATTDPLTGLGNRRAMNEAAQTLAEQPGTTGVIAIDLDHFKKINDSRGHAVGDRVLVQVANTLQRELRGGDCAYRIGGEEMVVLAQQCDAAGARALAERLRARIEAMIVSDKGARVPVTASFGVALWGGGGSLAAALEEADDALYHSKRNGRNRVTMR